MTKYNPKQIESKWNKIWEDSELYKAIDNDKREKYYCLDMFPYPSGSGLHVGHWRGFVLSDVMARYQMLNGKNVLHPMGWDAFGLPAENAAIKDKSHPKVYTEKAIDNFRKQIKQIGTCIDWSREINTSTPEYYKWTQWLFLQLYKNKLAYRKNAPVNWCPSCQTVLANEQVVSGECERCGSTVTKKDLTQWFFRITDFADDLLKDLDNIDWPERTKTLQRNWIGKSEGSEIKFKIVIASEAKQSIENEKIATSPLAPRNDIIEVFTTRADTIFGCTYVVLSPENELIKNLKLQINNYNEVEKYIEVSRKISDIDRTDMKKEKTGVLLEGIKAINPINNEQIPVYIADYVLASYGTGALMAVPAHDARDFEFAKKYNLPIKTVIVPKLIQSTEPAKYRPNEPIIKGESVIVFIKHPTEDKYLGLDWKEKAWGAKTLLTGTIDDLSPEETVLKEIDEETGYKNAKIIKKLGVIDGLFYHLPKKTNKLVRGHVYLVELKNEEHHKINDDEAARHETSWLSSDELLKFLTPETHLYALKWLNNNDQPFLEYGSLMDSGEFNGLTSAEAKKMITEKLKEIAAGDFKTNYRLRDWLISRQRYWGAPIPIIYCDKCDEVPVKEENLPVKLPEDVEFSPKGESPLASANDWLNVTCPVCGKPARRETDTMDTFVCSSWYYLRYTDPHNDKRYASSDMLKYWLPVDTYVGGVEHAILHLLYARFISKALNKYKYLDFNSTGEPFTKLFNIGMVYLHGAKMSKSKGNVVSPDELIEKYGTDALRGYELFIGPAEADSEWQVGGISGVYRFLEKVWQVYQNKLIDNDKVDIIIEKSIRDVTNDIINFQPNTAISNLMILFNHLSKTDSLTKNDAERICITLSPFFPHLAEEIWELLGNKESVFKAKWPAFDNNIIKEEKVNLVVSINGKHRETISVLPNLSQTDAETIVKNNEKVKSLLDGKTIKKVIYVSGRIINFVLQ